MAKKNKLYIFHNYAENVIHFKCIYVFIYNLVFGVV